VRPRVERVLDLGCGTGLCGRALRQHLAVGHLEGIDLSATMARAAQDSGAYDAVTTGDMVQTLRSSPRRVDLVLAADVFIYLGDLQPVFEALRGVLVPGGWLCFSVETMSDAETTAHPEGWCLRPSLRYAQSPAYLKQLCQHNGWRWAGWRPFDLRLDQGQALAGAVAWMQVPG
jgi:predicted TPR repeat methyltransferase